MALKTSGLGLGLVLPGLGLGLGLDTVGLVNITGFVYNVTNYYSVTDNIFLLIVDLAYVASK